MAKPLGAKGLQFYVNTEIGNLSAGSAAIAGDEGRLIPGEYGKVGSYRTGVKRYCRAETCSKLLKTPIPS